MTHDFRQDYEILALDERADWKSARAAYRRQVHLWHPDRYIQRPRELVYAQQRFIQLTRAFDSLRSFHRANHRLPFESIKRPVVANRDAVGESPVSAGAAASGGSGERDRPSEEAVLEAGILNLRPTTSKPSASRFGRLLWPALALVLMGLMLGTFLVLDRSASRATLAEGREVLRRTAPSEFMPSASEVQKRSSRGAFVERENSGRIGDQLMEDMFR